MREQKVEMYLLTNQKFFPQDKILHIKDELMSLSDARFNMLVTLDLKDPTTILLVSIFLGGLGIDRFMIGDTSMGILKLLTGGLCGILMIIDWFTISDAAKEKNYERLMRFIHFTV